MLSFPDLSPSTQSFFRTAYGLLQLANLLLYLPQARRFFVSERWKGYSQSSPAVDLIQNPVVMPGLMAFWILCAAGIALNRHVIFCSAVNLILCWYFFVWMRWRGGLRGSGAPGLMNYWLAAVVFFTEYTRRFVPELFQFTLLVFQIELAFIVFTSGFYKFNAGFPQNEGMDYGLVNPEWGYWPRWYRKIPPGNWIYKVYNQLAWSGQIVSAILMLIPQTRFWGGALLIASFVVIQGNIKLALLSFMMTLAGVLFFGPGSWGDKIISEVWPLASVYEAPILSSGQHAFNSVLKIFLPAYFFLLPFVYGGLYYNFYARRSLPSVLQKVLERYSNFFGMILWRVFTADLIDFYILIYRAPIRNATQRVLLSDWENWCCLRYRHVAESITVTTLFTTLKYYPSNPALFEERLLRYTRTLPCSDGEVLIFEYVRILKTKERYEFQSVEEFIVDPKKNSVDRIKKVRDFEIHAKTKNSPVYEAVQPGSYKSVR